MKRLIFCLIVLAAVQTQAQKPEVAAIREAYAKAKELISMQEKYPAAFYCSKTEMVSDYIVDGISPAHEVIQYFYEGEWDDDFGTTVYAPFFISRRYNVADEGFYEEYLFDDINYELIFYYQKQSDGSETRYYWSGGELVDEKINGGRGIDEAFAYRYANQYWEVFSRLMNSISD